MTQEFPNNTSLGLLSGGHSKSESLNPAICKACVPQGTDTQRGLHAMGACMYLCNVLRFKLELCPHSWLSACAPRNKNVSWIYFGTCSIYPGCTLSKATCAAKTQMGFFSAPMSEGVGLLRELRHLRAASRPPSLYLSPEEPPLESSTHHKVDDGAEKSHEGAPACV